MSWLLLTETPGPLLPLAAAAGGLRLMEGLRPPAAASPV